MTGWVFSAYAILIATTILLLLAGWRRLEMAGALFLFLLPLLNVAVPLDPANPEGKSISFDKLALVALAIIFASHLTSRRRALASLMESFTFWAWLAFAGLSLIAVFGSEATLQQQIWGLGETLLFFSAFACFFVVASEAEGRRWMWRAVLIAGSFLIGITAVQNAIFQLTGGPAAWRTSVHPQFHLSFIPDPILHFLSGPIGHPNFLAAMLVLLLPVFAFLFSANPRRRSLAIVISFILVVLVLMSKSLGGWGAMGIAFIALNFLLRRSPARKTQERTRFALFRICPVLLFVAFVLALASFPKVPTSVNVRLYVHQVGGMMIMERPLRGRGLDSFPVAFVETERKHKESLSQSGVFFPQRAKNLPISAHSSYLKAFVEAGIPGGIAFLLLIASALLEAKRRLAKEGAFSETLLETWGWAGCLGFAAQAATEELFSFPKTAIMFWALIALCLTAKKESKEDAGNRG